MGGAWRSGTARRNGSLQGSGAGCFPKNLALPTVSGPKPRPAPVPFQAFPAVVTPAPACGSQPGPALCPAHSPAPRPSTACLPALRGLCPRDLGPGAGPSREVWVRPPGLSALSGRRPTAAARLPRPMAPPSTDQGKVTRGRLPPPWAPGRVSGGGALTRLPSCTGIHAFTSSPTHTRAHSRSFTHSPLIQSLTHSSPTHSHTRSHTCSLTRSFLTLSFLTHSLGHSLPTHSSLLHTLAHTLIHSLLKQHQQERDV